ncbi:MAG: MoxR family ATPase [Nitrososphaerota archaeon]|nr:MoxR family ATPase [Nitrososphaerota archaeon]
MQEAAPLGPKSIEELGQLFERAKYVADSSILTTVYLALKLGKPLLIEGEAGCGKTELAKVLSESLGSRLIRLQCYEGLDSSSTLYEWDYLRQLLMIRIEENKKTTEQLKQSIFSEEFLLKRPLLDAVLDTGPRPPVLLIDEIDRADEEFEGFLLEFLAEFQVTIPELGTLKAKHRPLVVITSNRTRELGDGLRRRCLYLYVSFPTPEKELQIVKLKVPYVQERLARQVVEMMAKIRSLDDVVRKPGTAETLDWVSALVALGKEELDAAAAEQTISCVLKSSDELSRLKGERLASLMPGTGKDG